MPQKNNYPNNDDSRKFIKKIMKGRLLIIIVHQKKPPQHKNLRLNKSRVYDRSKPHCTRMKESVYTYEKILIEILNLVL